jgi:predicted enzyme related to lactoylglutathione lyase
VTVASRLTHFEIYGDDPERLAAFYRELLGWRIERAEGVDYWRIHLDPAEGSGAGGGLTYRPALASPGWMHYVNVESVDECLAAAQQMGAKVLKDKTAVPRTAWYAVLADPVGNAFAVWQPDPTAFPPPMPD